MRPARQPKTGMQFPVEVLSGKCIPEFGLGMGCAFRMGPHAESTSHSEGPSRFSESAKLKIAKRQLGAPPHLDANRTTILCHYLRIGSCGVGEIAPVIGLGRNNSAIATRHQPIQVGAHIAVAVTPGKMRRAV